MSSSTNIAVVPFLARSNTSFDESYWKENNNAVQNKLSVLCSPFSASENEIIDLPVGEKDDFEYNGWVFNSFKYKIYKGLYLNLWRKDKKEVFIVNESEYENIGYIEVSFFSKKKEDLAEFLKDQNLDFKIKANQAVKQTL